MENGQNNRNQYIAFCLLPLPLPLSSLTDRNYNFCVLHDYFYIIDDKNRRNSPLTW